MEFRLAAFFMTHTFISACPSLFPFPFLPHPTPTPPFLLLSAGSVFERRF